MWLEKMLNMAARTHVLAGKNLGLDSPGGVEIGQVASRKLLHLEIGLLEAGRRQ